METMLLKESGTKESKIAQTEAGLQSARIKKTDYTDWLQGKP
jgi:hypothetical protein